MEQTMITVRINGEEKQYPKGTEYGKIVEEYQGTTEFPIVLVMVDGKLKELHKTLKEEADLSFITLSDPAGHKTYERSAILIMLKAIYEVAGTENIDKVVVHYTIASGCYFTMEGKQELTEDFIAKVKAEMHRIVDAALPIMKRSVGTSEAIELFHNYRMYDKEKLFRYRRVSKVNIYSIEKFEDYFYGFMCQNTSYVKYFDLFLYDDGFVLQLPYKENPQVIPKFDPLPKIYQIQKKSEEWRKKMDIRTVGELNERITKDGIHNVLLIQEALQEAELSNIAEEILERDHVKFIMIAGPSSSGKTTFSNRLSIQLAAHGLRPHPIGVDNYFVDREQTPLDENGEKNYECLEAIDVKQFNQDMTDLLAGKRVEMPEFNFKLGKREYNGSYLQLGKEDVLVIEGIHGLNDKLSYSLPADSKFKIYISALTQLNVDEHNRIPTTDGRLIRRIVRDARTRGTSARNTIAMWPSVRRGEEQYIFPYQESADIMFNSTLIYELACLKVYAEPLLFEIDKSDPVYSEANRLLKFFDYFLPVPSEAIPHNSILREFVGGSCFNV